MSLPSISQHRELLACAESGMRKRRQVEVDDLLVLLTWADSHAGDPSSPPPREEPGPKPRGGPRLVTIAGEGTPQVLDLCFAEMAIARQRLFARLGDAEAAELEQTLDDLVGVLADRGDYDDQAQPSWDRLRAEGLGLLARPADALALLRGSTPDADSAAVDSDRTPRLPRRRALLVAPDRLDTVRGQGAGSSGVPRTHAA